MRGKRFSTSDITRGTLFQTYIYTLPPKRGALEPSKCLVIEDSPIGVEGDVLANIAVFGCAEFMEPYSLIRSGAHKAFHRVSDLVNEIREFEQANS